MAYYSQSPIYKPLNRGESEIRLLRLHTPAHETSLVECTIFTASLKSYPEFVALSYVWGNPSVTKTILVAGLPVRVPVNLAMALKQVVSTFGSRVIWADAVCINQNDMEERNHQVLIMDAIFKQARVVVSWLGPPDDTSHHAIRLLIKLSSTWTERFEGKENKGEKGLDLEKFKGLGELWEEVESGLSPLAVLFERSYWTRVWVFQEIALATGVRFLCGSDNFDANNVVEAVSLLTKVTETPGLLKPESILTLRHTGMGRIPSRLLGVLYHDNPAKIFELATDLQATNPRDHIYGLLGLINLHIEPDYSMSVCDVYCSFASTWITQTNRLDALIFAGLELASNSRSITGLPSWVPDWVGWANNPRTIIAFQKFHASGDTPAKVRISPDSRTIWPQGIFCDTITAQTIEGAECVEGEPSEIANYFWSMILNPLTTSYPAEVSRFEAAFWLVFYERHSELRADISSFSACVMKFLLILAVGTGNFQDVISKLPPADYDNLISRTLEDGDSSSALDNPPNYIAWLLQRFGNLTTFDLSAACSVLESFEDSKLVKGDLDLSDVFMKCQLRSRLFSTFHTSNGYLGLGPLCVAPGDLVCVLTGQDCPVVLRKKDAHFILVGECVTIGLMDGEAMQAVDAGTAEYQEFEIR